MSLILPQYNPVAILFMYSHSYSYPSHGSHRHRHCQTRLTIIYRKYFLFNGMLMMNNQLMARTTGICRDQ